MALSPDGNIVASGSVDGAVKLWEVATEMVIVTWIGHTTIVRSICWSPDGERVVSGSFDGTARVWDVESGKHVLCIGTGQDSVYAVSYSPNATKIATCGRERAIKIWDARTGELLSRVKHDNYASWSLAWTSDEKKLISGTVNGSIRIFDTATWQQIAVLNGHGGVVRAITLFSSDRLLASTSRTVRLWGLDTNLPVGPPLEHKGGVGCAAFSADGKLLATACHDQNAYVWNIHAVLKAAGLENLLLHQAIPDASKHELDQKIYAKSIIEHISHSSQDITDSDKSFLEADATRCLDQLGDVDELPPGFFHDIPDHIDSSPARGAHPGYSALLSRFSSLLRRFRPHPDEATNLQQPPVPSESR